VFPVNLFHCQRVNRHCVADREWSCPLLCRRWR
jgi:hypothetical protein